MNNGNVRDTPPAVQAIFDAMDAYLATTSYNNCNCSLLVDGQGKSYSIMSNEPGGGQVVYQIREPGTRVTLTPSSASLAAGATQQFAVTATRPDGSADPTPPAFSITPTDVGSISAGGLYSAPASIPVATTVTVKATVGAFFGTATLMLQTG